jgi:hypothetical protein
VPASPIFVKGTVRFELDNRKFEFRERNISQFGVNGLPWGELKATEHFGAKVRCDVEVNQSPAFSAGARIVREYTPTSESMGIRFDLPPAQQKTILDLIATRGYTPPEILRTYPRIPSNTIIQTYPTHAVVIPESSATLVLNEQTLVFDVVNLSPSGALLSTENQMALMMQPGERVLLTLQPRGWFPTQVRMEGQICRVVDDIHEDSGNLVRFLGVRFGKMDDLNKTAFLDLLKDILEQLKQAR